MNNRMEGVSYRCTVYSCQIDQLVFVYVRVHHLCPTHKMKCYPDHIWPAYESSLISILWILICRACALCTDCTQAHDVTQGCHIGLLADYRDVAVWCCSAICVGGLGSDGQLGAILMNLISDIFPSHLRSLLRSLCFPDRTLLQT